MESVTTNLLHDPRYGPWILTGSHHRQRGPNGGIDFHNTLRCFSLWYAPHGPVVLDGVRLNGPLGLFLGPDPLHLSAAPGVEIWHVEFDALFRQAWAASYTPPRRLPTQPEKNPEPQPKRDQLWGKALSPQLPAAWLPGLQQLLSHLLGLWWRGPLQAAEARHLLGLWLIQRTQEACLVTAQPSDLADRSPWLDAVLRIGQEQLEGGLGVRGLAAAMDMDRSAFSRRFRREAGRSAQSWLQAIRLQRARDLLANPNLSIGDVARGCGYDSTTAFSAAFQAAFSSSPSHWRQQHQRL